MIATFDVEGFRCLKNLDLELTPLHALIGPNDSGKTTILRALVKATTHASERTPSVEGTFSLGFVSAGGSCSVVAAKEAIAFSVQDGGRTASINITNNNGTLVRRNEGDYKWASSIVSEIKPAILVRFDVDALRQVSALLPEQRLREFLTSRGVGLPGAYQYIQGQGGDSFSAIESRARDLFPSIRSIRVVPKSPTELTIEVELLDGTKVGTPAMSDGLLYYLAFAAIRHISPAGTLLVEEPENGLHPARIRDVVRILRDYVGHNGAQVIIATHSPLVVNEFRPEEVTIITRTPEGGTRAVPIKDTPNFERRSKVAELGELWLSYADGKLEAPLVGSIH